MAHHHDHTHAHAHAHVHEMPSLNRAFLIGIALNLLFVFVEFLAGLYFDSLGLLSDAGHNLSDVAGLVLAMLAFRLSRARPTRRYTYGYKKSTILVSLLNALILLVAVGLIIGESIGKILYPQPVEGHAIAWVAGAGVVINGITAWLFMKDKDRDLNVKGAYLHMAADALVSIGVVVSGLLITFTGWYILDPIIGLLIAGIIVYSTWGLLNAGLRLSLDGVPDGMEPEKVEKVILQVEGVQDVHHLHIWAISTTETALTTHVRIDDKGSLEDIKLWIKNSLKEIGIQHSTLEFELDDHCHEKYDTL